MLSADTKLVPVPTADYIAKNAPERYIKDVPIYVVGIKKAVADDVVQYNRAYKQVSFLYDNIVKKREATMARVHRHRENKVATLRNE